jgi:hypothetical protein
MEKPEVGGQTEKTRDRKLETGRVKERDRGQRWREARDDCTSSNYNYFIPGQYGCYLDIPAFSR